jgi:hypothetical protein
MTYIEFLEALARIVDKKEFLEKDLVFFKLRNCFFNVPFIVLKFYT